MRPRSAGAASARERGGRRGRPRAPEGPGGLSLPGRAPAALSVLLDAVAAAGAHDGDGWVASAADQRLHAELVDVVLRVTVLALAKRRGLVPERASLAAALAALREPLAEAAPVLFATCLPGGVLSLDAPAVAAAHAELFAGGDERASVASPPALREDPRGELAIEELGGVYEALMGSRIERASTPWARPMLRPGTARRRSGAHYTPRSLAGPIVERTLAAVLSPHGAPPSAAQILRLRLCDPAMGSGAFLLEACRALARALCAAWAREGAVSAVTDVHGDAELHARRLVAARCLYGVDRNATAVELARLSLWLMGAAADGIGPLVGDKFRHGDSLVGLGEDGLRSFHWATDAPALLAPFVDALLTRARVACSRLDALAAGRSDLASAPERWRLERELAMAREHLRLVGDVAVGAFFAQGRDGDRERDRSTRLGLVRRWLESGAPPTPDLVAWQAELRTGVPAFHWPVELPEVFADGHGMHAFVGNPPFLGGKRISTEHGERFAAWLERLHGTSKNTDLAAHFFRRAATLLGRDGAIGLVATNSIAEGDNRRWGLRQLVVEGGFRIHHAQRSVPWPGDAAVHIAVVHLARGAAAGGSGAELDGRPVAAIDSRLQPVAERDEPAVLASNKDLCFIGCFLRGAGFVLTAEEAARVRRRHDEHVLRPFLGGDEVNRSPTQDHARWVIDFGDRSLEEAAHHAQLLALVEERVRPVRMALKDRGVDAGHRRRWWQFANTRPELRRALAPLAECLVIPRVSKHLCVAYQPTDRVFSDQLCVVASASPALFAILQSRVHELWARLCSSTLGVGLRYAPSDCLETFPFPTPGEPSAPRPALAAVGERLRAARARYLLAEGIGLTTAYNGLKDRQRDEPPLAELRALHEAVDACVLAAYGWDDLARTVPPFALQTGEVRDHFATEVLDRLFALGQERAGHAVVGSRGR